MSSQPDRQQVLRPQLSGALLAQAEAIASRDERTPGDVVHRLLGAALPLAASLSVAAACHVMEAIAEGRYTAPSIEGRVREAGEQGPPLIQQKAVELRRLIGNLDELGSTTGRWSAANL